MKSRRVVQIAAPVLALSLVAAACGDNDKKAEGTAASKTGTDIMTADTKSGDETKPADDSKTASGDTMSSADSKTGSATGSATPATTAAPEPSNTIPEGGELPAKAEGEIIVTGPERSAEEAGSLQQVLGAWGKENGVKVTYLGDAAWETNINTQIEAGNAPDISIFPQPGKLADFARAGSVVPLNDAAAKAVDTNWDKSWTVFGNVDGKQYGVPVKADLKSLVWYQPARFKKAGYEVPTTQEEFKALMDKMVADGGPKALCVGIESGPATGWPYTDWVEELVLRNAGPDVYDQWVSHKIPFNDPKIVEAMQSVLDMWGPDYVFSSSGTIAATSFQDNGKPLVDGDCYMHRQASFFSAFIPEGTAFADGSEGAVDVFYFPGDGKSKPVEGAGTLAAAFNKDNPKVMDLLAYMSTPQYAEARQKAQHELKGGGTALSGFLSAAKGQDPKVYQPLEQSMLDILATSSVVRFDASDLMPADVGAGTFWTEGTAAVNGDQTAQEAADKIEASWPKS